MGLINVIEFHTPIGYKSVELHQADITTFTKACDLLVISAFQGDYTPTENSLIGALKSELNIDVSLLANSKALDLSVPMHVWLSQELHTTKFRRIACIEGMLAFDSQEGVRQSFLNLFSFVSMLTFHDIAVGSICLPLLGSGDQQISKDEIVPLMMYYCRKALETTPHLSTIYIVERSQDKIHDLMVGLNAYLKNEDFDLSMIGKIDASEVLIGQIVKSLKSLMSASEFFRQDETSQILLHRLEVNDLRAYEFGILCRRFVEVIVNRLLNRKEDERYASLYDRINKLHEKKISRWIIDYFHTIRRIGNIAAHAQEKDSQLIPAKIGKNDIQALIVILNCITDFLNNSANDFKEKSITL
jgi:hypothetical protein